MSSAAASGAPDAQPAFDRSSAFTALKAACAEQGIDTTGATLLRLGENAIFRLVDPPIVVRIARHRDGPQKEVAVARWLADVNFPAARLFEGLPQLCEASGRLVTWWEFIDSVGPEPSYPELASILRALHGTAPQGVERYLPQFEPMPRVTGRLNAQHLANLDRSPLVAMHDRLEREFRNLNFELPVGPIHGDAHPGNLMRRASGEIVLIDFEAFSWGPREWDLTSLAAAYVAFGWMDRREYQVCVEEYGRDVVAWPGFGTLRSIRELNMTTWLMQLWGHSSDIDTEIVRRMRDLRGGLGRRNWRRV